MEESNESLDDAFKSADFSDKVWMFFTRYARPIASAGAVICLISCLALIIMVGRSMCEKFMKAAYWEAIQTDTRERFVRKYISNPLGGTIFLELGDEAYQKKEYQQAADYYHHARISLGSNILGSRAAIGEGIALIKSELRADGEGVLAAVRDEKSYPMSIRGQGAYLLAHSLYGCGESDKAKNMLNQLINGNFSDSWKIAGKTLLQEIEAAQ
jgi:tetratricopeptide (TPR) repeat protein